jgi:hypothetical protein
MGCFSEQAQQLFKDWKQDKLLADLERDHAQLIERRVASIHYGAPGALTSKKRAILNSQVLRQALLHRADCLMVGSGQMLVAKNVYGLALVARGHLEATAVLAYFCDRIDALSKANIEFVKFEWDVADAVLGAKHELFTKANSPQNIMTCIEKGDRFLNNIIFEKRVGLLSDCYIWLSEFSHPNFCSNKSAFALDKEKGDMIFRHDGDIQEADFQLLAHLKLSAAIFPILFDRFGTETERLLAE